MLHCGVWLESLWRGFRSFLTVTVPTAQLNSHPGVRPTVTLGLCRCSSRSRGVRPRRLPRLEQGSPGPPAPRGTGCDRRNRCSASLAPASARFRAGKEMQKELRRDEGSDWTSYRRSDRKPGTRSFPDATPSPPTLLGRNTSCFRRAARLYVAGKSPEYI